MPRGRPREFDEQQALRAALMLFWQRGYEGTSVAALAEEMEINLPSLYSAFGNKETLFRRSVENYLQGPASYLPKALQAPTIREVVEQLFRGAIDMVMNPRHPDGCLLVQGALSTGPGAEPARRELNRMRSAAEAAVRRRFERALTQGDWPSTVDPTQYARYVMTVIWGMSVQAAGGAGRRELEEVAGMATATFLGKNPL